MQTVLLGAYAALLIMPERPTTATHNKATANRHARQAVKTNSSSMSVTRIPGIGPALANKLAALGIHSLTDLLFHLPLRYEDRSKVYAIRALKNGMRGTIEGEITDNRIVFGKRRQLQCSLRDPTGTLLLRFFHFSSAQRALLEPGTTVRCFGEVSLTRAGLSMIHPEFERVDANQPRALDAVAPTLTPVYPSREGLQQARWRKYLSASFQLLDSSNLTDLISADWLKAAGLDDNISLFESLRQLHFPPTQIDIGLLEQGLHPLQRRLAFEELVTHRVLQLHTKSRNKRAAMPIPLNHNIEQSLLTKLPFQLTSAQSRVIEQIKHDIQQPIAMNRLVQGDVGSGKTIVGAIAAAHAASHNIQCALMAPTEILAEQHALTLSQVLEPLGISVQLLTSKQPSATKKQTLNAIACGEVQVVVGTHALIQQQVEFHNLGLAIIDEQHRFGVDQRKMLLDKRNDTLSVHQLVMTATPIPRTLAMTFLADLDYSVIDELPPGRKPITTIALSNERRNDVIERVRLACEGGRQVYWVCTLVDESEVLAAEAAESTAAMLAKLLPRIRIGLIHGRLKPEEKALLMAQFKQGDFDLLVATTVIEVGVDVANASLMIIENAERLGLAQLHQLRGRVGRGEIDSHCVLLYQKPLSNNGKQRLDIMRSTQDGFLIAERDLHMRGAGELLGTKQSGSALMRIADLERDADLVETVVAASDAIAKQPSVSNALIQRWCPHAERYTDV